MKIFRTSALKKLLYFACFVLLMPGCNKISQGDQRKKFEFLYKMNNYSSLFREYTGGINYSADMDFYTGRMKKLYEDINLMETINGYGASRILKEKFLSAIDENVNTANLIKQKNLPAKENIRQDYNVIIMNERVDDFIKDLNDEITVVGKE